MEIIVKFELDESWDEYKDCNPELLIEDMELIHKKGIKIKDSKIVNKNGI